MTMMMMNVEGMGLSLFLSLSKQKMSGGVSDHTKRHTCVYAHCAQITNTAHWCLQLLTVIQF